MAAETETLETVQALTQSGYKWGFETNIDMEIAPKGLNEDTSA
jgi:Fe-S cluster assembly protein SufB